MPRPTRGTGCPGSSLHDEDRGQVGPAPTLEQLTPTGGAGEGETPVEIEPGQVKPVRPTGDGHKTRR